MTDTQTPNTCCNDVFEALGVYSTGSTTQLAAALPNAFYNAIVNGEALLLEQANRTSLMAVLNGECRCNCCEGAAVAIPQFYLAALTQAVAAAQNGFYSTAFVGVAPANVVVAPLPIGTDGYVDVAASLAAYKAANPTATPAQIAAQQAAILAFRSTYQVYVEDVLAAQAAAQTATVVNYATCADSSSTCPQQQCFVANKCDTSSSTTCPPKVIKVSKPKKDCKPCAKPSKPAKVCKTGTCHRK